MSIATLTQAEFLAQQIAAAEDFGRRNNLHPATGPGFQTEWKVEHCAAIEDALKAGEPVYDGWQADYRGLAFRLRRKSG